MDTEYGPNELDYPSEFRVQSIQIGQVQLSDADASKPRRTIFDGAKEPMNMFANSLTIMKSIVHASG